MRKITTYQSDDGSIFSNKQDAIKHDAKILGLSYECPNCNGTTEVIDKNKPIFGEKKEFDGTDNYTYTRIVIRYEMKTCPICSGRGYTKEEKTPIIKIIGYK